MRELQAVLATASGETPRARAMVALVAPSPGEAAPARLETLTEALDWHAERHGDQCHAVAIRREGEDFRLSYRDLSAGSRRVAAGLIREGTVPGDRVGIMLPTGRAFLFAFFGCLYAGAMPTPIACLGPLAAS